MTTVKHEAHHGSLGQPWPDLVLRTMPLLGASQSTAPEGAHPLSAPEKLGYSTALLKFPHSYPHPGYQAVSWE